MASSYVCTYCGEENKPEDPLCFACGCFNVQSTNSQPPLTQQQQVQRSERFGISRRGLVVGGGVVIGACLFGGWLLWPQLSAPVKEKDTSLSAQVPQHYYYWSADLQYVAKVDRSDENNTVYIYDVAANTEMSSFVIGKNLHVFYSIPVTWSLSGAFVYARHSDHCLIWDVKSGKNIRNLTNEKVTFIFYGLVCAPDGRIMVLYNNHHLFFWDINGGVILFEEQLAEINIRNIAWSSDSVFLSLIDSNHMTVQIYDVHNRTIMVIIALQEINSIYTSSSDIPWARTKMAWSQDNSLIAFTFDSMLLLLNPGDADDIQILKDTLEKDDPVTLLAWSPDNIYLAVVQPTTLEVWHSKERKLIYRVNSMPNIRVLTWKDQSTIWGGDESGKVHHWEIGLEE